MIRRTQHTLKFITAKKRAHLDALFLEYQTVVNEFIEMYWEVDDLPSKPNKEQWRQVTTWLCGKVVKCACRQAFQMIKTARKKNRSLIYQAYREVFKWAKSKGKDWPITRMKWAEWSKGKVFRQRVKTPYFNGNSIDLNSDLVSIYLKPNKMKEFDLAIRLGSIWGNRLSLVLPTKKHAHFNGLVADGFVVGSSAQLRRIDGNYYINLFLDKETPELKDGGKAVGIDVGIKKLMSTSEGEFLGLDVEWKIQKLKRRERDSHNYKQTIQEIKHYTGEMANKLDLSDVSVLVVEDLDLVNMKRKGGKSNKNFRKTLANWNIGLLQWRLSSRCELNRVQFAKVDPAYSSQECSSCGNIRKESRKGERYDCPRCGASLDADHNAAMNIRNRFRGGEHTVPHEREHSTLCKIE